MQPLEEQMTEEQRHSFGVCASKDKAVEEQTAQVEVASKDEATLIRDILIHHSVAPADIQMKECLRAVGATSHAFNHSH